MIFKRKCCKIVLWYRVYKLLLVENCVYRKLAHQINAKRVIEPNILFPFEPLQHARRTNSSKLPEIVPLHYPHRILRIDYRLLFRVSGDNAAKLQTLLLLQTSQTTPTPNSRLLFTRAEMGIEIRHERSIPQLSQHSINSTNKERSGR